MSSDSSNAPELARLPRVLLADDSRMVRISLIKHIKSHCQIQEVSDGEEAWAALLADPSIDILITDIGMPNLDGYGLLARLRASEDIRLRELPAIVISGEEDEASRARAREAGATDFITKGIGTSELLSRLEALSSLVQTRRNLAASQAAHAAQSPVDPASGLSTPAYMVQHGAQELAAAKRHQASLSAMSIEVDDSDNLRRLLGDEVFGRIVTKLGQTLRAKVRTEDTVSPQGAAGFAVLSPLTDIKGCEVFAQRLVAAVAGMKLAFRGRALSVNISVGLANTLVDGIESVETLFERARARMGEARAQGGGQVVSVSGAAVAPAVFPGLDAVLRRLQAGQPCPEIATPALIAALMPLLELVESRTRAGLPLAALRQIQASG